VGHGRGDGAYLQGKAIDDALELLDLLMVTELLGTAERISEKETLRTHPRLARASMKLALAVSVLFEVTDHGGEVSLDELWEAIEVLTPRRELHAAMETVEDLVPDSEAADLDTHTRALLAGRIATVSGFVKILTQHVEFGADPEARVVLEAMRALPRLLDGRRKIVREDLGEELLSGSWRRLVLPGAGRIDRTPTCSACSPISTAISSAARSTPRPPPAGATRRPSSWTRAPIDWPGMRRSPRWGCPPIRPRCWSSTP
jgi:hypothetical protein